MQRFRTRSSLTLKSNFRTYCFIFKFLHVSGGVDRTWKPINSLEILDLTNYKLGEDSKKLKWQSLVPLQRPASRVHLVNSNNEIFTIGWYRDFPYSIEGKQYPFGNIYDPENQETKHKFKGLKSFHDGGISFKYGDKVVIMGGQETKFGRFSVEVMSVDSGKVERIERVPYGFVDRSGKGADLSFSYYEN